MAASVEDARRSLVECGICISTLSSDVPSRVPMLLSCGHTFCSTCVSRLAVPASSGSNIVCPHCRQVDDQHPLRKNFMLMSIIRELHLSTDDGATVDSIPQPTLLPKHQTDYLSEKQVLGESTKQALPGITPTAPPYTGDTESQNTTLDLELDAKESTFTKDLKQTSPDIIFVPFSITKTESLAKLDAWFAAQHVPAADELGAPREVASINAILVPFWEISGTVSALSYQRLPDGNEIEKRINRQVALFTTCGARDQEIHNAVMKHFPEWHVKKFSKYSPGNTEATKSPGFFSKMFGAISSGPSFVIATEEPRQRRLAFLHPMAVWDKSAQKELAIKEVKAECTELMRKELIQRRPITAQQDPSATPEVVSDIPCLAKLTKAKWKLLYFPLFFVDYWLGPVRYVALIRGTDGEVRGDLPATF